MTFADLYARALWRQPHHVCGEAMLPLTVGHARILESMGYWNPSSWLELMTCAWICGRPPGAFREPRGRLERFCWTIRLWRLGHTSFPEQVLAWRRYVSHHIDAPVISWPGGGGRMSGTPTFAALRIALIRMGYSPERVDDVPVDQALLDQYGMLEADGRLTVSPRSKADLEEQFQEARRHVQSLGKN